VFGAGLAWLASLLLTAAAVEILARRREGRVRVWRTVLDTGSRFLWVYLRIALLSLVLIAIGGRVIGMIFERMGDHGQVAGWSARTLLWTLPIWRVALLLVWATLVGVLAWWCRVIAVADARRYLRRMPGPALRLLWRRPVQAWLAHVAASLASVILGGVVLLFWRQSPAGPTGWTALWLLVLLVQSFVWHWRLRAGRLVWDAEDQRDLRSRPDGPWHWPRRLVDRLRRPRPLNQPNLNS
jgi:hypothetical protein